MQFDRLETLMSQQGKTKKHMGEIVGKGSYYIKDCKTKGIQIPEDIIKKWAADLGTTYEYLMGKTEKVTPPSPSDATELLTMWEKLSDKNKKAVVELVRQLAGE